MKTLVVQRNSNEYKQMIKDELANSIAAEFIRDGYTLVDIHDTTEEELSPVLSDLQKPVTKKFDYNAWLKGKL